MGFATENRYYSIKHQKKTLQLWATKLTEKIPVPLKAREYYQSFLRKKNTKLVKRPKIITQQPKSVESQTLLI